MKKTIKTLCLIMFVTLYTFSLTCQNVKAYKYGDNMSATFIATTTRFGGGTDIGQITLSQEFTQNQNNRGVFMKFSEEELNEIYNTPNSFRNSMNSGYVYFSKRSFGPTVESHTVSTDIYVSAIVWQYQSPIDSYIQNQTGLDIENFCLFGASIPDDNNRMLITQVELQSESIEYVDTLEDLKAFFQGDDSVVKNGNPGESAVTQDNTLPVPQSLTCDLHNRYTGTTPLIIGGWSNPANASFDAIKDSVKIHIQYKPSFQYYKRFIAVKDEVVTARDWIDLGTFDNNNKNKWVNCFPNTPQTDTNVIKFETLQRDMQVVASYNNNDPREATLSNGTSWRVRYEMPDGRVSYWAVYNIKAIGTMKYADDVTFQDNEDNVVSSDAVSYQNSEQTDPQNQDRDNSLLGRLKIALNNIQSLPKDMQTVADEGSSFANFLKKVWDKFPEIYILFIGGLIIAIILRILGR